MNRRIIVPAVVAAVCLGVGIGIGLAVSPAPDPKSTPEYEALAADRDDAKSELEELREQLLAAQVDADKWAQVEAEQAAAAAEAARDAEAAREAAADGVSLGTPVELDESVITILAAERRDVIDREHSDDLAPGDGESLWLLSMEWTNTSDEAVSKVCWGPYAAEVRVYDTQGREMLLNQDSGGIAGNDCTNGLMTGQSGQWFAAYDGLADAEISHAFIGEGFGSTPVRVNLTSD